MREQKVEANLIGGCFAIALVGLVFAAVLSTSVPLIVSGAFGLLILPLRVTFLQSGRMRLLLALGTLVLFGFAVPILSLILLGPGLSPFHDIKFAGDCYFDYFVPGAILSTWIPLLLSARTFSR